MNYWIKVVLFFACFYLIAWPFLPFLLQDQINWIKNFKKRNKVCILLGHRFERTENGCGEVKGPFIWKCKRCGEWTWGE